MTPPSQPPHWSTLPHAPPPGTPVGTVDALPDGVPTLTAIDTGGEPSQTFGLMLLRSGAQVKAFVNRCAHFGVPLAVRQDLLIFKPHTSITCNVHYARYRWDDGRCEAGDCEGESLVSVPLEVHDDGSIFISAAPPHHA